MSDTKGNIRARRLGNTGITEDILKRIADAHGGHVLAIVELKADTISEKVDGDDRLVDFLIDTIEPVVDGNLNGQLTEHVRTIQAALFRNRKLDENGAQLPLDSDGPEPSIADAVAHGKSLIDTDDDGPKVWDGQVDDDLATPDDPAYDPHDYLEGPDGVCTLCDQAPDAAVHTTDSEPAMT